MTVRSSSLPVFVCLAALMLFPVATYVSGYLWLGELGITLCEASGPHGEDVLISGYVRDYPHLWQPIVFHPAAQVESWLWRCEVETAYGGE